MDTLISFDETSRFEFGRNWSRFLRSVNAEHVAEAERSLCEMLEVQALQGIRFLDIGSGSGLFSLAAHRLGAQVHSFDYDQHSVACAVELKRCYFHQDPHWRIEQGSVLDTSYMLSLGRFDIVYSWGVLHHTGAMWKALENALFSVAPCGRLYIAIYNDQGWRSVCWRHIKRIYNRVPAAVKFLMALVTFGVVWGAKIVRDSLMGRPLQSWMYYIKARGMSPWWDVVDWVGGYPFEVARPEQIIRFCRDRGFALVNLKTCGGKLGNNEYVFYRQTD